MCPQRLLCSCLLQILLQFLALLAGALANVTFLVVPHTGICWLADIEVLFCNIQLSSILLGTLLFIPTHLALCFLPLSPAEGSDEAGIVQE
ncbi:hypothetical protein DV515_00014428, partial [Chloebia gouldiae]